MAKKRELKRSIDYVCSDLFAEAVAASLYGKKINQENLDALLRVILSVHNDFYPPHFASRAGTSCKSLLQSNYQ